MKTILFTTLLLLGTFFAAWAAQTGNPKTTLHYAAGGGVDPAGAYPAAKAGFNVVSLNTPDAMPQVPKDLKVLIYLGLCNGADAHFVSTVKSYMPNDTLRDKIFGFYLMDEPELTGEHACTAEHLKAESDWIHANIKGAKTFIVLLVSGSPAAPEFAGTYMSQNTHIDLFGLDPYPCKIGIKKCDVNLIKRYVVAAKKAGLDPGHIIPVYQAFGGEQYRLPTTAETKRMLAIWKNLIPSPVFDYAYSWTSQPGDQTLAASPPLQRVFAAHNKQ